MIHLVLREPVPYQLTLCRSLEEGFRGSFKAWFHERTEFAGDAVDEDRFRQEYLSEVGYLRFLKALIRDSGPVIILGGWSSPMTVRTLFFATVLRIPVFIWADHPHPRRRSAVKTTLRRFFLRCLTMRVEGFLACGAPTAQHLAELGIPAEKITEFPYWVKVPARWSLPARCIQANDQPLRLIAVGRQVPVKQFDVAIEAIARANRNGKCAELVLVGDGPERRRLEARAAELGCSQSVSFRGWLSNDEVYREIARADALLLTSKFDAYGVVVLEAMAMGRAVFASHGVIAARDRGREGGVMFHATGDVAVLAGQLQELARHRELLRELSRAARATAEKWPPEMAAEILNSLLTDTQFADAEVVDLIDQGGNPTTPERAMSAR